MGDAKEPNWPPGHPRYKGPPQVKPDPPPAPPPPVHARVELVGRRLTEEELNRPIKDSALATQTITAVSIQKDAIVLTLSNGSKFTVAGDNLKWSQRWGEV